MLAKNLQKLIEQSSFSALGFFSIFVAGYFLSAESFFVFSYSFTLIQALTLLYFSYISNSFFVFFSKQPKPGLLGDALLLLLLLNSIVAAPLVALVGFKTDNWYVAGLGAITVLLWCVLDLFRKVFFIRGSRFLLLPSVSVLITFLLLLAASVLFNLLSAAVVYGCLSLALAIVVIVLSAQLRPELKLSSIGHYARQNHSFAIWNTYSALISWGLTGGILLHFESSLSEAQFNACRILLSFIGLANLITTVIENNLILKLSSERTNLDAGWWLKYLLLSLLLAVFVAVLSYAGFHVFYQQYIAQFYQVAAILLLSVFFTLNKPMIALLKVVNQTRRIFFALVLAASVALFVINLTSIEDAAIRLSMAMFSGAASLTLFLAFFYLRAVREHK